MQHFIQQHNSPPVASSTTPLKLKTEKDFFSLEKPNGNLNVERRPFLNRPDIIAHKAEGSFL